MNENQWIIPTSLKRFSAHMRAWREIPEPVICQRSNGEIEFRLFNGLPCACVEGDRWYPHEYFVEPVEYAFADDDLSDPCTWMQHDDDPGDCGFDSQFPLWKLKAPGRALWRFIDVPEQHFPVTAPAKQ